MNCVTATNTTNITALFINLIGLVFSVAIKPEKWLLDGKRYAGNFVGGMYWALTLNLL
jgi:hypothetical protein